MSVYFQNAFAHVLGVEGRYSDDAADRGGKTMYGITEKTARENGYLGPMTELTTDIAKEIYKRAYWDRLMLDEVSEMSEAIGLEMFDTGVNCGVGIAGRFLQRALNSLNREAKDYVDLVVDGAVGWKTVGAMRAFLDKRGDDGERVLFKLLKAQQAVRYMEIAEKDRTQERFMFGWVLNRV